MRYASIRSLDITNGDGVGASIFVQGCPFRCKNCFNPETWDFNGGKELTEDIKNNFLDIINKPYINRVSILGGEPLERPREIFLLVKEIKEKFPNKDIWLYSGYTYEQICQVRERLKVLCYIDVLVDGPYIDEQRDITLAFRGSKNQRLIDVKKTLKQGIITILDTTK